MVEQQVHADTEAYRTLEDNLKKMGFERATNDKGQPQSWRWQTRTDSGSAIILEFLADDPKRGGGRVGPLFVFLFGTELVAAEDRSIVALLGASPGCPYRKLNLTSS